MFCIFMVKKHSVLLLNNAIFTIEFNGLAQFFTCLLYTSDAADDG
ncbi:hypothetical protein ELO33_14990, partial [Klebsiella pneumoniae]|nr:hypothetical protein [Klebsiella pneumoniae]